tara:strand:+ start:26 stop:607 length:582 start_codon:yes stop_codon:yes gene_type:complete
MSKVVIAGDVNGSGVFTISAPNGNTNRTLTLPDEAGTIATTAFVTNRLVQNLNVTTGAFASGTTLIPRDNTIPQITEGDQYMTLAITPTSATSKLEITVVIAALGHSVSSYPIVALFVGTTANALAAVNTGFGSDLGGAVFVHSMVAGVTTELIFRVRAGANDAGTTVFNGVSASARLGGSMASSITIKEYAA